ncbi:MAG: amino acid ABC transporter permease [Candidatus Izemoplasmatales bacterium]|jgi:putative lysine transport system permease protein|nr:amino acid ABC transporter permease [Candidatus Izemoplasmatales bacterium]
MRKVFKKVILFTLVFGIIIVIFPKTNAEYINNATTENETLNDAIENVKFYSSFNYQTLTQDKLNKLTADFYLPVEYFGVSISYVIDSEYLALSQETEIINLRQGTSTIEKEVLKVTVLNLPNIIKGEQEFVIQATFNYLEKSFTYNYQGFITPVIPDDFLGGALYTLVRYGKMFLEGAGLTLLISLIGTVLGFILALFLATAKIIAPTPQDKALGRFLKIFFNKLSSTYITIFRGTPMIVQASFFWYGFGLFGNALLCGLFVVSLNTAAYIAEIIRGSVNTIDKGQTEGSLALGLSYSQTFIFVIFPQAIKNSMPAIGNEFVINIKDTAVLSVIGIFELFNQTKKITSLHYRQLEAYAIVALIYLILTYSITSILKLIEKRMGMKPLELTSSN